MKKNRLFLFGSLILALGLLFVLRPLEKTALVPLEPQPPILVEKEKPPVVAYLPQPPSRGQKSSTKPSSLTPSEIESITKRASSLYDSMRENLSTNSNLHFELLEKQLGITQSWDTFGPFTRKDFPEITNGHQAAVLVNALNNALSFSLYYFNSLKSPAAKERMENAIMNKTTPSLAIDVRPQFHFTRLTGREAAAFPKELVPAVRKLWRNALAQETLLTEEREIWESSLATIAEREGIEFPLKMKEEDVFPVLSSIDNKLMEIREGYLGNLERIFRGHGLLEDR